MRAHSFQFFYVCSFFFICVLNFFVCVLNFYHLFVCVLHFSLPTFLSSLHLITLCDRHTFIIAVLFIINVFFYCLIVSYFYLNESY